MRSYREGFNLPEVSEDLFDLSHVSVGFALQADFVRHWEFQALYVFDILPELHLLLEVNPRVLYLLQRA